MDWIVVYTIIIWTIAVVGPMFNDGRQSKVDWYDGLIGTVFLLPVFGRVFGWW